MPLADLVVRNALVYTLNPAHPQARALAIEAGRIVALDDDPAGTGLPPARRSLDLHGYTVLPGLTDAHIHMEWFARRLSQVDVEVDSKVEALARVAERARRTPPGNWITGGGWSQSRWGDGEFPTAADLDTVAPDHPVYLDAKSGHAAWVNSAALRHAGITASTPDPQGGSIGHLPGSREPSGILLEDASHLVERLVPVPTDDELAEALSHAFEIAWQHGLTGVHDLDGRKCFVALQLLRERGRLGLRVVKNLPVTLLDHAIALGLRSGFGDDWLRIGNVKVFADGALGPRTAAMFQPYEGEPDNRGLLTTDQEELMGIASRAAAAGLGMTVHAIGDRANHEVLNALGAVPAATPNSGRRLRHRIEHVQLIHPSDARRLAELGIIASMQPLHATSDMDMAERYWGARSALAYAWRTQLDAGAVLAFGSDCPVETLDPLAGIHAAVTRRRADGRPGPAGWYPEQRLTVEEAVRAYTWGPAYAAGMEDRLGTLSPAKLADLVVLSHNLFEIDPAQILTTRVMGTMIDGKFVYQAEEF